MVDHQHRSGCFWVLDYIIIAHLEFPSGINDVMCGDGGLSAPDDRRWNWRLESRLYPQTGMSALRAVFCSLLSRSADCVPCLSAFSFQPSALFKMSPRHLKWREMSRRHLTRSGDRLYWRGCGRHVAGGAATGEDRPSQGRALLGLAWETRATQKGRKTQRNTQKHNTKK